MAGTDVVVTGANGFVGRHVIGALRAPEAGARGLVRSAAAAAIVEAAGGRPMHVEALDEAVLAAAFEGARSVVHLAQIGAERDGARFAAINVAGTRAVVDASRSAGVERIVFLSGLGVAHYGIKRRCTNSYFLSKLAAEQALFDSGMEVSVFRPSYVLGRESALVADLAEQVAAGSVELVGSGWQRMQPIAVTDAAALIARAAAGLEPPPGRPPHHVFDLVGPEPLALRDFTMRLAAARGARGVAWCDVSEAEAERQAASGGYRGMLPDELDCLLCDEVGDPAPLEALLGRPLTAIDAMLAGLA